MRIPYPHSGSDRYLDCSIDLARRRVQSYQAELVGTNSSGDFGARGNILYQNWNLFRGAEVLNLRLTGAIEGPDKPERIINITPCTNRG